MSTLRHQSNLHAALGDAIAAPDAPEFMSIDKEAAALLVLCSYFICNARAGAIPVVKLMALSQQAIRCAALAYSQEGERNHVVDHLLSKAVPK
jgi:hypothetical protein